MTVTNQRADDRHKNDAVEAEAIRLWLKSPFTMVATVILHLAAVWALWSILPHYKLIAWGSAGIGWCALRFVVWLRYARGAWTDCKARGFDVTYWQTDERGRWQRRE